MSDPGTPTFDQLRLFLTVVETGSFAAAARRLHRTVSVVSYGIGNLEAQLGLTLFERAATRRPQLTEAGRAVLADARGVAAAIDALRAKAKGLLGGLEAEVNLAVDVMLPPARLASVLHSFADTYPTVALRLHVEALGAVTAMVLDRAAVIGISGPLSAGVAGSTRSRRDRSSWCRSRRRSIRSRATCSACPARRARMSSSCSATDRR